MKWSGVISGCARVKAMCRGGPAGREKGSTYSNYSINQSMCGISAAQVWMSEERWTINSIGEHRTRDCQGAVFKPLASQSIEWNE